MTSTVEENSPLVRPIKAMLFASMEFDSLQHQIEDDRIVFEQKLDGTRTLMRLVDGTMTAFSRHGVELKHTASTQHLPAIRESLERVMHILDPGALFWLDGELMHDTGHYYLFDMPYTAQMGVRPGVVPLDPFSHRRVMLERLTTLLGDRVRIVKQHVGAAAKQSLVNAVVASEGEGVIVKHIDAPYNEGERVKHSLKAKIIRSVDVVVMSVNRPTPKSGSIEFGVHTPVGQLIRLGSVSAIGRPNVQPGDVIEVQYLGWIEKGGLREPRMVRQRFDKAPRECLSDQLTAYSKAVV